MEILGFRSTYLAHSKKSVVVISQLHSLAYIRLLLRHNLCQNTQIITPKKSTVTEEKQVA
jgi:hypothetical protein